MIIYKIKNLINSKCYIGKTTQGFKKRKKEHLSSGRSTAKRYDTPLYRAMKKYGIENFEFEIIFEDKNITEQELFEKEIYFIKKYKSTNKKYGYNLTHGGEGLSGLNFSEEHKKRISISHIKNNLRGEKSKHWKGGRYKDSDGYIWVRVVEHPFRNKTDCVAEHRLVMEKHLLRYLRRDEYVIHINRIKSDNRIENLKLVTKKEVSEFSAKERIISDETKEKLRIAHLGEKNHFFGKKHSEETIIKMRKASSNRSDDVKQKLRIAQLGKKASEETKQKMKISQKIASIKKKNKPNYIKPGGWQRLKTHCPKGHAYEGDNLVIDGGSRRCKTCRNESTRLRKMRKRLDH